MSAPERLRQGFESKSDRHVRSLWHQRLRGQRGEKLTIENKNRANYDGDPQCLLLGMSCHCLTSLGFGSVSKDEILSNTLLIVSAGDHWSFKMSKLHHKHTRRKK